MRPVDAIKLLLMLAAIVLWMMGYRSRNGTLMQVALAFVVVAFALRFLKLRPPDAPTS